MPYGVTADKELVREPVYDVSRSTGWLLASLVNPLLEQALKATNARTAIEGYDQDDAVLGELR